MFPGSIDHSRPPLSRAALHQCSPPLRTLSAGQLIVSTTRPCLLKCLFQDPHNWVGTPVQHRMQTPTTPIIVVAHSDSGCVTSPLCGRGSTVSAQPLCWAELPGRRSALRWFRQQESLYQHTDTVLSLHFLTTVDLSQWTCFYPAYSNYYAVIMNSYSSYMQLCVRTQGWLFTLSSGDPSLLHLLRLWNCLGR